MHLNKAGVGCKRLGLPFAGAPCDAGKVAGVGTLAVDIHIVRGNVSSLSRGKHTTLNMKPARGVLKVSGRVHFQVLPRRQTAGSPDLVQSIPVTGRNSISG